jgi:hypothetical protein
MLELKSYYSDVKEVNFEVSCNCYKDLGVNSCPILCLAVI